MQAMMDYALAYARKGYHVFPLCPNAKFPRTKNGFLDATIDESVIEAWWRECPDANIGIACAKSGIVVVDIDCHPGDPDGKQVFEALDGFEISPPGPKANTAQGGGIHLYYAAPELWEGVRIKKNVCTSVQAIHNGYVVTAPSVYKGQAYRWQEGFSLLESEPPPLPAWLRSHVLQTQAVMNPIDIGLSEVSITSPSEEDRELVPKALTFIEADDRDRWIDVGMALKDGGFSLEDWIVWSQKSEKYVPDDCVKEWKSFKRNGGAFVRRITLRTLYWYGKQGGFRFPSSRYKFDDIGNAQRLIDLYGHNLRWFSATRHFLVWDKTHWKTDDLEQALAYAKDAAREILRDAAECTDDARRLQLIGWAKTSATASRLDAMLKLAKPNLAIAPNNLDRDHFKFNCLNGTIDLRTATFVAHSREDFVTKLAPIEYHPEAKAPRFKQFLEETFDGSQGLIDFVQCALGYALTGSVKEQKLFICYGGGQNGKSTLFNVVRDILGDYAQETDPNLLLARRDADGASPGVARLRGVRFATTMETKEGAKLDETVVKHLTGGDKVIARPLYGDFVEFEPTHKLFMITNDKPRVYSQSVAMWRRIKAIPFSVQVPEIKKDQNLGDKLREESEGILVWLVQGCLKWQTEGLPEPPEVEIATAEYKADEDSLERFIQERCRVGDSAQVQSSSLRIHYKNWCIETGESELNRNALTKRMEEKGFEYKKTNRGKIWLGLTPLDGEHSTMEVESGATLA